MSRPPVGGDTTTIASGGALLSTAATGVKSIGTGVPAAFSGAVGGVGDGTLAAALQRYAAAAEATASAIGTQLSAASELAINAAADLTTAGGH